MEARRPTESDLGAVADLLRTVETADTGEPEWDERQLREHWKRSIDPGRDAWLVELDGVLAGYVDLEERPGGRMQSDGYVHPDLRGRGVGAELLRLVEAEARSRAAAGGVAGRVFLQNATTADADAFYRARGFEPVRRFRRMLAELRGEPGVPAPPGVELRPIRAGEERAVHEVLEEAFEEHWQHRRRTFDEYAKRTFAREDYDATLCPVAVVNGVLAGASLNWWKDMGDWGWVGAIGVVPAFRSRGLGEALLLWSFAEFFRRGEPRVALGVDAQNETGATRLYERLGMRTLWEAVVWEKEL